MLLEIDSTANGHARSTTSTDIWVLLARREPSDIAIFLSNAHPQIIAVVLSQLPMEVRTSILNLLPLEIQADVFFRLCNLSETSTPMLQGLKRVLWEQIDTMAQSGSTRIDGLELAMRTLTTLSQDLQEKLVAYIREEDASLGNLLSKISTKSATDG